MKYGLWKTLTTFGVTTAVLAGLNLPIQAQSDANLVRLLDTTCVSNIGSSWGKENTEVSIGKEAYTAIASILRNSGFSCRFGGNSRNQYQTLTLNFGLNDTYNNDDVILNVYLDGKLVESPTVNRGPAQTLTFDVRGKRSVALEAVCPDGKNSCSSWIYFHWAHLQKR
jgi:hypothetical protein